MKSLTKATRQFSSFDPTRYHASQTAQLEASLTLVDKQDNIVGSVSKLHGHLRQSHEQDGMLPHRAFSLFLFNTRNELLMQQRSDKKITFPGLWTNTCCSHPEHTPSEMDTSNHWVGPRRAALRRTKFEMNVELDLVDLQCGSRILYYAPADETFAEHELDYIIFAKKDLPVVEPNADEVKATEWVGLRDLDDFI